MEVQKEFGSYHIIDGEKVSIRYRGQTRTCARCHQGVSQCPGSGLAKDCEADRVLLSTHMKEHWDKIGYKPEVPDSEDVDEEQEPPIQLGRQSSPPPVPVTPRPEMAAKYNQVSIRGVDKDVTDEEIGKVIQDNLQQTTEMEISIERTRNGNITISDIDSATCQNIVTLFSGSTHFGKQTAATPIVSTTPEKSQTSESESETEEEVETNDVQETATKSLRPKRKPSASPLQDDKDKTDKKKTKSTNSKKNP